MFAKTPERQMHMRQRQHRRVDPKTGRTSYELAKVKKNSWLGRNYSYLQFGLFYLGWCIRLLFVNSDRLALAIFLIFTIVSAIAVGYLYVYPEYGKSLRIQTEKRATEEGFID